MNTPLLNALNTIMVWTLIAERFGVLGAHETVAPLRIDDLPYDDIEIQRRCEALQHDLGIPLELPCLHKTIGDLADYCIRALFKRQQPCR